MCLLNMVGYFITSGAVDWKHWFVEVGQGFPGAKVAGA
jgi:hypothetical protein